MTNSYRDLRLDATHQQHGWKSSVETPLFILLLALLATLCFAGTAFATTTRKLPSIIFADLDDRGRDGIIDAKAVRLNESERDQLHRVHARSLGPLARLKTNPNITLRDLSGKKVKQPTTKRLLLQGIKAGIVTLDTPQGTQRISVIEVGLKSRTRLSLLRQLPRFLDSTHHLSEDETSFIVTIRSPLNARLGTLDITSLDEKGRFLDRLGQVEFKQVDCPHDDTETHLCTESQPLYLVGSPAESQHPLMARRALIAAVGGRIKVSRKGIGEITFDVGSPASLPVDRYQTQLRVSVLASPSGLKPIVGTDQQDSYKLLRKEVQRASQVWGACGVDVKIAPDDGFAIRPFPKGSLLVFGCHGLNKAQGGQVGLEVSGKKFLFNTQKEENVESISIRVTKTLESAGFVVRRYANPLVEGEAGSSVDLMVKRPQGDWLEISPLYATPSNDPGIGVCITKVNLNDGLEHFIDATSARGTQEERALVRQIQDADPNTIELIVIPHFSGNGRIGESFLAGLGNSIENIMIIDRAGLRANARSLTIAHELGHLLLNMPGHPDDYGVDRPAQLMDADSSDASLFGPRRIPLSQCRRALKQSGPGAIRPLISPNPLQNKSGL